MSVRALVAVGLVLGLGLAAPAPGDEIELGSIRIETPEGDLRGREFHRGIMAGLLVMRDKSPYLAQLLRAAQDAPFPIVLHPLMEDRAMSLHNDPYRPYARVGGSRVLGRDGTIGYPAAVYLTLANVNPYWSESKRGMLAHELVHAVDLVYGRSHPERLVRERRASFMENVWRDVHGWRLTEQYFDGKLPAFETLSISAPRAVARSLGASRCSSAPARSTVPEAAAASHALLNSLHACTHSFRFSGSSWMKSLLTRPGMSSSCISLISAGVRFFRCTVVVIR